MTTCRFDGTAGRRRFGAARLTENAMSRVLPYIPRSTKGSRLEAARRFDEAVFERFPQLNAFVRLPIDEEFNDAPDALRLALEIAPMTPFLFIVRVTRGIDGGLFPHRREVLQVRVVDGFDSSIGGILRGGFLTRNSSIGSVS